MNIETGQTIVHIILMGVLPLIGLLMALVSLKVKSFFNIGFGFLLMVPSIIIILSLIK
tara:strand:- start:292 stop:465 length:174 start_codon:yes stop_codon:yes gene_type:complete